MKWFKHISGSLNDSFIFELIEKFGGDGYLVFFGTLEAMTDEFDIYNPGKNRFLIKKLTKNFQLSRQKTVKIWKVCDERARENRQKELGFFVSINENYVDLYCPRLKDLTDEYTAKQLKQLSGQKPDKVPIVSGQTPEQEAEADKEKKEDHIVISKNEKPAADLSPTPKHYKDVLTDPQTKEIDRYCKTLGKHFKGYNFHQWVQQQINRQYRVEAIILALKGLWNNKEDNKKGPWPYLIHILSIEHQNINEREHVQEHEERKKDELKFTGKESVNDMAEGITKPI